MQTTIFTILTPKYGINYEHGASAELVLAPIFTIGQPFRDINIIQYIFHLCLPVWDFDSRRDPLLENY